MKSQNGGPTSLWSLAISSTSVCSSANAANHIIIIINIIIIKRFNVAYVTRLLLGPQKRARSSQKSETESDRKMTNVKSVGPGISAGTEKSWNAVWRRSDSAEVMSSGSSFQMLAPATGNDRLPNVVRRQNVQSNGWRKPIWACVDWGRQRRGWSTTTRSLKHFRRVVKTAGCQDIIIIIIIIIIVIRFIRGVFREALAPAPPPLWKWKNWPLLMSWTS